MTNYHQLKGTLHKKEMLLSYNNEIADVENRRVDTVGGARIEKTV